MDQPALRRHPLANRAFTSRASGRLATGFVQFRLMIPESHTRLDRPAPVLRLRVDQMALETWRGRR
jgi:hypothetical protein